MKFVKLKRAISNNNLFSFSESGLYMSSTLKSASLSGENFCACIESLSLSTLDRLVHILSMSNFPPCSFLPACTPFTIIPASSLMRLCGYFSTTSFMSFTHPVASPSFSLASPPIKRNLSRLAPNGNLWAEICVLLCTSANLSFLKAS